LPVLQAASTTSSNDNVPNDFRRETTLRCPPGRLVDAERILVFIGDINGGFMDVNPRGCRRGVSEQGLHGRLADPAANHFGRQPVAEGVRRNFAFNTEPFTKLRNDVLHGAGTDALPGFTKFISPTEGR